MSTTNSGVRRLWHRIAPSAARTRIMGMVLLLVMAALVIVTFVTWRLLVSVIDARMDRALRLEVEEFAELTAPGINPRTGHPFTSVEQMISEAIAYNIARPNEKFLGYVDGKYRTQSRQQPGYPEVLAKDDTFTSLVGSVTKPTEGQYRQPEIGEVRYLAIPVKLAGDPSRGVIVAAYLGDAERADANGAARLMLVAGGLTLLGATAAAWLVAGRILRPLRDVTETARRITDSDLSQRIPTGAYHKGDELDDLVHTVNGMLDRVESGVLAQRRFIDDAGHELRTPITIVRGHLEVLDPNDPDDIRATAALLDDELVRMNRMVSDLLLLARSVQPSFVQPRPVYVAALTREVFEKVTQLGDRDFSLQSVAEVDAVLDPQRITQALVALADNACHYTKDGDQIGIGSAVMGEWLWFWVSDSGPGVSAEDRARIFERFARGTAGGHRSDGAGLGLSIVQAIAKAHDGHVELDSTPGSGATFIVVVPVGKGESCHAS
ncbi:sensor histidine kinase [Mycobacterium spongiae]|uniref:sensor histidine kinase n=1 Tax=Mycobacterium spongiae TaxID=886343 RepID=UPI001FE6C9E4|nr:HAMP domain-containing sensor histidine kinase [Mycobacterium spongiae]